MVDLIDRQMPVHPQKCQPVRVPEHPIEPDDDVAVAGDGAESATREMRGARRVGVAGEIAGWRVVNDPGCAQLLRDEEIVALS
jgi:hypothetical protein